MGSAALLRVAENLQVRRSPEFCQRPTKLPLSVPLVASALLTWKVPGTSAATAVAASQLVAIAEPAPSASR
jgi:hypothetical protein